MRCLVVRCCADRGRAEPRRPHRDLDLPRLDPRFVPQKSTAVRYRNGVIAYPTTAPLVLNHPLADPIRGFCKQGVRARTGDRSREGVGSIRFHAIELKGIVAGAHTAEGVNDGTSGLGAQSE